MCRRSWRQPTLLIGRVVPGQSVVQVDQTRSDAEGFHGVSLGGEILFVRGYASVSDQIFIHTGTVRFARSSGQERSRKWPQPGTRTTPGKPSEGPAA